MNVADMSEEFQEYEHKENTHHIGNTLTRNVCANNYFVCSHNDMTNYFQNSNQNDFMIESNFGWFGNLFVKYFSEFDFPYENSENLAKNILKNSNFEDIVDQLEELKITKKSHWDNKKCQIVTTYSLPIKHEQKFKLKDEFQKIIKKSKIVTVYGNKYDPFFSYEKNIVEDIQNEVNSISTSSTSLNSTDRTQKFKKYVPMNIECESFNEDNRITPLSFSYEQTDNSDRMFVANRIKPFYEPKNVPMYYGKHCYFSHECNNFLIRPQTSFFTEMIQNLNNHDEIVINFKKAVTLKYIETIGSLAPLNPVPPLNIANAYENKMFVHKGIYVKDTSVTTTWADGFELFCVIKNKIIFINTFCANSDEFNKSLNDVSGLCPDKVKKIIIKPHSNFPIFCMHLTLYGIVENETNILDKTVDYNVKFKLHKKPNRVIKNNHTKKNYDWNHRFFSKNSKKGKIIKNMKKDIDDFYEYCQSD